MASHRKPRTGILQSPAARRGAVGASAAALASVTLLSQSANAAPGDGDDKPTLEETKKKVDELHRQAGAATQKYNAAKEKTAQQRKKVDAMLDDVAKRTDQLNDARRTLSTFATAQYRTGGVSDTATLLLADDPQGYFSQSHVMERLTVKQKKAVEDFKEQQREASKKRAKAAKSLSGLTEAQKQLAKDKKTVQTKLSQARTLLSELTAEEKARLAAIEKKKQEEARRKAAEAERKAEEERKQREAAARKAAQEEEQPQQEEEQPPPSTAQPTDDSYAAKAEKVIEFAKGELGKPYVWGATGPNSYDCSGFTQAAWRAAGVELPRVTYDQVNVGTKVAKSDMKPGDLIFFYDDISHVGIYVGGGQMIHASKPGDDVKYESIDYMPFHSAVRPA